MNFLVRVVINGVAIWFAALLLSGLEIVGGTTTLQRIGVIALIALVFGIVNAIVKPVAQILSRWQSAGLQRRAHAISTS